VRRKNVAIALVAACVSVVVLLGAINGWQLPLTPPDRADSEDNGNGQPKTNGDDAATSDGASAAATNEVPQPPIEHATAEEVVHRLVRGDLADNTIDPELTNKLIDVIFRPDMTLREALSANIIYTVFKERHQAGVLPPESRDLYLDAVVRGLDHPNFYMRLTAADTAVSENLPASDPYVLARLEEMADSDPAKDTAEHVAELLHRWYKARRDHDGADDVAP